MMNSLPRETRDAWGPKTEWLNGQRQLHREDGPSVIWEDGFLQWHIYGQLHREDGPAIEWPGHEEDKPSQWYINGRELRDEKLEAFLKERIKEMMLMVLYWRERWLIDPTAPVRGRAQCIVNMHKRCVEAGIDLPGWRELSDACLQWDQTRRDEVQSDVGSDE